MLICALAMGALPPGVTPSPRRMYLFPCAMTRYSTPLKLGWVVGLAANIPAGGTFHHGPFLQLEPGFGGGKINLGYRFGEMRFMPLYSLGLSASVLRTWGNPLGDVEPGQTYVGPELSVSLFVLGLNAGVFRHVGGDDDGHDWITTLGVGAGF